MFRQRFVGWLALAAALGLMTACGGGSGGAGSTDAVNVTVIDGAIGNALVCLDKNTNGACDGGEPQGRTDAAGKVTLTVDKADTGKYPVLALVGLDATDAVHGKVMTAFTLTAPADKASVVSPLTTLVQQVIADTGASSTDAATTVQNLTGLSVSVFDDYTKAAAPTSGTDPGTLARMLVLTTQEQTKVVAAVVGTNDANGKQITPADVALAVRKKLLERMPALLTAITQAAVTGAATPKDKDAALLAAAMPLATDASALTVAGLPTVVAINTALMSPPPVTAHVPSAGFTLANLDFTDPSDYFVRYFTASLAQNTPDADNMTKYVNRYYRAVDGNLARWGGGVGSGPARNADLNWNGSAWVPCMLNFENKSTLRDAQGNSSYTYCDNKETGSGNSATFDIAGKTMKEVYDSIRAAGYTNLSILGQSVGTVLGSATFPPESKLRYSTGTSLTTAISYYPAGKDNPLDTSNVVSRNSASDVAEAGTAGGVASAQRVGEGCNAPYPDSLSKVATLESLVSSRPGYGCEYGPGSFVYNGVTKMSDVPNVSWGGYTVALGRLGNAPTNTGSVAPGYYTSNTKFRVAFAGAGTNPTVYYACKERFTDGSTRSCTQIGTGSYSIQTLGDARVMTFNNLPAQMAATTYTQAYVERGGFVYYGYINKLGVSSNARLNTVAGTALLTQLGLPVDDPSTPLTLTTGSYQGTYDVSNAGPSHPNGVIVYINANGTVSCQDSVTFASESTCSLTTTNAQTGAFTATVGTASLSGSIDFLTGVGNGTLGAPDSGSFMVFRR